jgi:hypothetical protein
MAQETKQMYYVNQDGFLPVNEPVTVKEIEDGFAYVSNGKATHKVYVPDISPIPLQPDEYDRELNDDTQD